MILKKIKIKKEWTDYNGHMNVAFYIHVFDTSAEFILNKFNMGGKSEKKSKKSTFVVESHTTYNREVRLGEEVEVHLTYFDLRLIILSGSRTDPLLGSPFFIMSTNSIPLITFP